jgi:hypothetical protein
MAAEGVAWGATAWAQRGRLGRTDLVVRRPGLRDFCAREARAFRDSNGRSMCDGGWTTKDDGVRGDGRRTKDDGNLCHPY